MKRWMMISGISAAAALSVLLGAAGCGSGETGDNCAAETPGSCPSTPPSYKTNVAPILQSRCTSCHSPTGSQSAQPLDTYAGVKAESGQMKERVTNCTMPPAGSMQLTAEEANTILGWLVCGAQDN